MRISPHAIAWLAAFAMWMGCSSDPERVNFAYMRSPSLFAADTAATAHPFCREGNPVGSPEECNRAKKYRLTWLRPEDTTHLRGYRIYLDTAPGDKHWNSIKDRPELASLIIDRIPLRDSVVFVFTDKGISRPDTLGKDDGRIVVIDSVDRSELRTGRLMFGLVPVYGGGVTPGQPGFSWFVTSDPQPPDVFNPNFRPLQNGVAVAWERPTDRVSFFNPSNDTGIIKEYRLELEIKGRITDERVRNFRPRVKSYLRGGEDSTAAVDTSWLRRTGFADRVTFILPDGRRSAKHTNPDATDSMRLEIEGLQPQDTLGLKLFAVDSAGRENDSAMEQVTLRTTDTTQPSPPKLSVDSLGRNGFIIVWKASRDSVASPGGGKDTADRPNANIKEYRLTRILARAPGERTTSLDRVDTTVQLDSVEAKRTEFRVPVRFLPPGRTYRLNIVAEDSSGFPSPPETLSVTTPKVAFSDSDSALVCPPGFVPMPRAAFQLGDKASKDADEQDARTVSMEPFCIEPYEHRDSTGRRFMSNVTYERAEAICKDIDPDFDTRLCSEAEWERACEGPLAGSPLLHGIQSEGKDASILQTSCNQGTNDSAMAMTFELRNPVCLTTEGVYDMAGNLTEWVRDVYAPGAYRKLQPDPAMGHSTLLADPSDDSTHSVRGGNYLKPNLSQQALVQSLARCSNRDFPKQVRPLFRPDCKSEGRPKVAVVYGPGLEGHRCIDVEDDNKIGPDVTELVPAPRDTFAILVFRQGIARPETIRLDREGDTTFNAFKGRKPIAAYVTKRALAAVRFERVPPAPDTSDWYPDTLDATEFKDTSQAGLERIFRREAANSDWAVAKKDGKYDIRYLYAYTITGSRPALPYYSSRAIGFRCCSLARKPVSPTDSLVSNP